MITKGASQISFHIGIWKSVATFWSKAKHFHLVMLYHGKDSEVLIVFKKTFSIGIYIDCNTQGNAPNQIQRYLDCFRIKAPYLKFIINMINNMIHHHFKLWKNLIKIWKFFFFFKLLQFHSFHHCLSKHNPIRNHLRIFLFWLFDQIGNTSYKRHH